MPSLIAPRICSHNFNDLVDGIGHCLLHARTTMRATRLLVPLWQAHSSGGVPGCQAARWSRGPPDHLRLIDWCTTAKHGMRDASGCASRICHRNLAEGEPVYQWRGAGGRRWNWCDDCARGTLEWRAPEPCEGCSRPVILAAHLRLGLHVTCGEPSCLRAVHTAQARVRR